MKLTIQQAVHDFVENPCMLTAAILSNVLWDFHKEIAASNQIPTKLSGWFLSLQGKNQIYGDQRNACDVILKVADTKPTKTEWKKVLENDYLKPLLTLEMVDLTGTSNQTVVTQETDTQEVVKTEEL